MHVPFIPIELASTNLVMIKLTFTSLMDDIENCRVVLRESYTTCECITPPQSAMDLGIQMLQAECKISSIWAISGKIIHSTETCDTVYSFKGKEAASFAFQPFRFPRLIQTESLSQNKSFLT